MLTEMQAEAVLAEKGFLRGAHVLLDRPIQVSRNGVAIEGCVFTLTPRFAKHVQQTIEATPFHRKWHELGWDEFKAYAK